MGRVGRPSRLGKTRGRAQLIPIEAEGAGLVVGIRCRDHSLSELDIGVEVLDEIGLIDNVDQVLRFGHTPEDFMDAEAKRPFS